MARDINFCIVLPWETLEPRLLKRKIKCGHFSTCDGAALLLSTNVVLNRFVWKTQEAVENEIVSCVWWQILIQSPQFSQINKL